MASTVIELSTTTIVTKYIDKSGSHIVIKSTIHKSTF